MAERNIECYLCGKKAVEKFNYNNSGNTIVECSGDCIPYETTFQARKFYLKKDWQEFTEQDRQRIVKKIEDIYEDKPVRIKTEFIRRITRK